MQNIQDLKENIFFEFKNIIGKLEKINNVEELISQQDLVDKLAKRVSFLKLLQENIEYYTTENSFSEDKPIRFTLENTSYEDDVIEEEVIFNHKLNEVGAFENQENVLESEIEEEALFNNELNEISSEESIFIVDTEEEEEEEKLSISEINVLHFVDEERILEDSQPEDEDDEYDDDESEFVEESVEEEVSFNNQLNEIDTFENIVSDDSAEDIYSEEEQHIINNQFEKQLEEEADTEFKLHNDDIVTEYSTLDNILLDIKNDPVEEETSEFEEQFENLPQEDSVVAEETEENETAEEAAERKIKLSNIKGLKSEGEPLTEESKVEETPTTFTKPVVTTSFMNAEPKQEFRLDLNDKLAFSKVLFGGSQRDLNLAVSELNRCRTLEEAKEYLSDLYYDRDWAKVDEYAQRLWILVENKFL